MARVLITTGIIFIAAGLLVLAAGRFDFLGRLPGDFTLRRGNFTLYVPLATMLVASLILTLVLNIVSRR